MSRGLGRIERQILEILRARGALRTQELADTIAGGPQVSRSLDAAVRRACAGLRRKGLIDGFRANRHAIWYVPGEGGGSDSGEAAVGTPGRLPDAERERLVRLLGMMGSAHEGERANVAALLERERRRLNLTWEEIVRHYVA